MNKPKPRSVLSLDVGRKRVGLAGCDPLGISITPLKAIIRNKFENDIEIIKFHCNKRNVKGIILGMPLNVDGEQTFQSKHCYLYGTKVAKLLKLPIALVNEHCTTWEAKQRYNLVNDRTGRLDSASASLILEQWLEEGPDF